MKEVNWMAGGPQGAGVDSAANIFGRACGYGGLYVYGKREYHSNIKGLHSYFHMRVSDSEVQANVNDVHLLAAFDAETVVRHLDEVTNDGGVIVDRDQISTNIFSIPTLPYEYKDQLRKEISQKAIGETLTDSLDAAQKRGVRVFLIPYMDLLKRVAGKLKIEKISSVTRMTNILTVGVSFSLLHYEKELVEKAIDAVFSDKPKVAAMNIVALNEAYDYAQQTFKNSFPHNLEKRSVEEERIFISGNQAVALGKVLGGCRIQTYYPITPAADESEYLEAHEIFKKKDGDASIVVIQTEDEIAAVNSASGAALAGARAATSTSGPGFSLMVEGLSWAGNCEVPLVITYYQRGAPATGLPTRFGQSDLQFAVHAGHGDFPRIVLASGDIKECFYDAALSFNYAEKYQMPVIHFIDKALANSSQTYGVFDKGQFKVERGAILRESDLQGQEYRRFRFTENGVSPRAFLGTKNSVQWYTGDEHNEVGHISEEPQNRNMMMEKRMKKLETADKEIPVEQRLSVFGSRNSPNMIISWGSPKGAIIEAITRLNGEGFAVGFLQIRMILPFPKEQVAGLLKPAQRIITVENNYSGQLAEIVKQETGIVANFRVLKYNGRPMSTTEVYDALKKILLNQGEERQVLTYGS
jgi:2-oxoglutarate/2-oxoacid ferredoxin oxidoreductase subunit alpha